MDIKDINSEIRGVASIMPQSTAATVTGEIVDLAGDQALSVNVAVGALTGVDASNYLTFTVEMGNDSGGTDFAAVDAAQYFGARDQSGNTWDRKVNAAGEANRNCQFGVINSGDMRYARVVATETGAVTAALISAVIVKGGLRAKP